MSMATINSFYGGLEPFPIVEAPRTSRPGPGSWRGYCNLLMVGATGRNDRATGWPDGLEGQVVAVKLGLSTRARGELSFFPAPPTTDVKVYTRQWRAGAVANILGMNRDLKLVRTMAILAGPAANGLVAAVGHLSSALSGGNCSTK